MLLTIEGSSGR